MSEILVTFSLLLNVQHVKGQWVQVGLDHRDICSVVTDPRSPGVIYAASISNFSAGTVGQLFKSTDGGGTWDTLAPRGAFQTLAVDPDSSNIVYAGMGTANGGQPGIVKTTDGGFTWLHADSGLNSSLGVVGITIDRRDPEVIFAGLVGMLSGALFKSTNAGASWHSVADSSGSGEPGLSAGIQTTAIDPDTVSRMFAGGGWRGDLMMSVDSGQTWRIGVPQLITATEIVYGAHGNDIYVAGFSSPSTPKGMLHSTDGGVNWMPIVNGLPGNYASVSAIQRTEFAGRQRLFIGAETWMSQYPYAGIVQGVFTSTDSGNTWQNLGLDSVLIQSLAVAPDGSKIYAGVFGVNQGWPGGVYARSGDLSVDQSSWILPKTIRVYQNYPNPFNPSTTFTYDLNAPGRVTAMIYTIDGKRMKCLLNSDQPTGFHSVVWDGRDDQGRQSSSGLYIFRLQTLSLETGRLGIGTAKAVLVRSIISD